MYNNTIITKINNNNGYFIINAKNFKKIYINENGDFLQYFIKQLNYLLNEIKKPVTIILDVFNFYRKQITMPFLMKFVNYFKQPVIRELYLNSFKRILILNYNQGFKNLFGIIRLFMDKELKEKIEFRNKIKAKDWSNVEKRCEQELIIGK